VLSQAQPRTHRCHGRIAVTERIAVARSVRSGTAKVSYTTTISGSFNAAIADMIRSEARW
jgi:hypothetical protein